MSDLKQTAMQDLRADLIETIDSGGTALMEINDEKIRNACIVVLTKTINQIVKRIDEELLPIEREHIIEAHSDGIEVGGRSEANNLTPNTQLFGDYYFIETFKQ